MMKLPYELQPGDRFYYRHSVGEEVKLWKVVATGLNSLIATTKWLSQIVISAMYLPNPVFLKPCLGPSIPEPEAGSAKPPKLSWEQYT
jgi:hypothetical protein